jgi:hypothetical protein
MGTESLWVPLAISALSAGAGAYNNKRAADKQEEVATNMSRQQQRHQRDADAALDGNLDALAASDGDAERQQSLDGFLQQLRANQQSSRGTPGSEGGERFQQDSATAQAAVKNYGGKRSDVLSRIAAPGRQRQNEGIAANRAQDDVAGIARNASGDEFLKRLRMQSIVPDPWLMAASQVGQGVASGMASRVPTGGVDVIKQGGWTGQQVSDAAKSIPKFSPFGARG